MYSRIIGVGFATPKNVVKVEDTESGTFLGKFGIETKHVCDLGDNIFTLQKAAIELALKNTEILPTEIDWLLTGGFPAGIPYVLQPNESAPLAHAIGAGNCIAQKVENACSSLIRQMFFADLLIKSGHAKIVVCSNACDWSRNASEDTAGALLGDGCAAILLKVSDEPGLLSFCLTTDGSYWDAIRIENGNSSAPIFKN